MIKIIFPIVLLVLTLPMKAQTVSDADGNSYNTVTIGTQVWLKENLKTTKLNDNTNIPKVETRGSEWYNLTSPAYRWTQVDNPTYETTYGILYNWYAINTNKLCPVGWQVPSDADWATLINFLGGFDIAGGKLKESGTAHWIGLNTDSDNSSGFTALPGAVCDRNGDVDGVGDAGNWWRSTECNADSSWFFQMTFFDTKVIRNKYKKKAGLSVRCISGSAIIEFTITFKTNGGSLVNNIGAANNSTIGAPTVPTKTGYTFAGWYKEATCTNAWNFDTDVVTANTTLYAKWTQAVNKVGSIATNTNLTLYPQPAEDAVTLKGSNLQQAIIYNSLGTAVMQVNLQGQDETAINVSELKSGIYFVRVQMAEGKVESLKMLKK